MLPNVQWLEWQQVTSVSHERAEMQSSRVQQTLGVNALVVEWE